MSNQPTLEEIGIELGLARARLAGLVKAMLNAIDRDAGPDERQRHLDRLRELSEAECVLDYAWGEAYAAELRLTTPCSTPSASTR